MLNFFVQRNLYITLGIDLWNNEVILTPEKPKEGRSLQTLFNLVLFYGQFDLVLFNSENEPGANLESFQYQDQRVEEPNVGE